MIITATKYELSPRMSIAGTRGSYGIETINLSLSDDFDGLDVRLCFYPADGSTGVTVVYAGEPVTIPAELLSVAGWGRMTVVGSRNGVALITLATVLQVLDTPQPADAEPMPPTPSEIEQVYGYLQAAVETAQSVRHDADSGEFDGADGAPGRDGRDGLDGAPGRQIELQKSATHIQWRYVGDTEWTELISLDELVVAGGGDAVPIATISVAGKVKVGDGLSIDADGTLSVDCATAVERDNTKPVTSGAVYTEVGNIAVLLAAL